MQAGGISMIRSKLKQPKRSPEDDLFSEYIRKRAIMVEGGCQRCGAKKYDIQKDNGKVLEAWRQLDCAHLISRRHHGTRWEASNGQGLCSGCHFYIDSLDRKDIFIVEKIGLHEYQSLLFKKETVHHIDHAAVILYLKKLIVELNYEAPLRDR